MKKQKQEDEKEKKAEQMLEKTRKRRNLHTTENMTEKYLLYLERESVEKTTIKAKSKCENEEKKNWTEEKEERM